MPETLETEEEIELSLLHEMIHYRDKHLLYKVASLFVAGIHWFNPLCRIMCRDINFSCELCCDQQVIRRLDEAGRLRYGKLLLRTATLSSQILHSSMPLSGKETLKRRLLFIMNHQTSKKLMPFCLIGALSCMAVVCSITVTALAPDISLSSHALSNSEVTEIYDSSPTSAIPEQGAFQKAETANNNANPTTIAEDANTTYVGGKMAWPVIGFNQILQEYGWTDDGKIFNTEILIGGKEKLSIEGADIVAANDGIVEKAVTPADAAKQGYGSYLIINHGGDVTTVYNHCKSISVAKGDIVKKGQPIATVGSTGSIEYPAVGFGVRVNGVAVNPDLYFSEQETFPEVEALDFMWPVDGGYISCGIWGYPNHTGTDIAAPEGTDIYAAADGIVTKASNSKGYGNNIVISHGTVKTKYSHCKELFVEEGQKVNKGDKIATIGRSGNGTAFMCHFEVLRDGAFIDPETYIGHAYPSTK